jgi:hypothetical protein
VRLRFVPLSRKLLGQAVKIADTAFGDAATRNDVRITFGIYLREAYKKEASIAKFYVVYDGRMQLQ